ncbi:hypothetical protein [Streptomyces sp. NPDC049555]|uniref:hypothetical protein n=1 Tax=unclassified Streptomyces TaxID=2593676 RepID=UPI00343CF0C8
MKTRTFRLAPAVAAATAVLLTATAGAAVAAPSDESPSASTSASASPIDGWTKRGHYDDEKACVEAGKKGQGHGDWHEYQCKREYDNDHYRYYWWLYTH